MFNWAAGRLKRTWRGLGARLRRWAYGLSASVILPIFGVRLVWGLEAMDSWVSLLEPVGVGIGAVSLGLLVGGWVLRWWRSRSGSLSVNWDAQKQLIGLVGDGVDKTVDKTLAVSDVRSAFFMPASAHALRGDLVIETAGGVEYHLKMARAAARAWLRETRLGPRHRATRVQSATTMLGVLGIVGYVLLIPSLLLSAFGTLAPVFLIEALLSGVTEGLLYHVVLVLYCGLIYLSAADMMVLLLRFVVGQEIVLGTDGIRWGKGPWRTFVPYADIESLRVDAGRKGKGLRQDVLVLRAKDGKEHQIKLRGFQRGAAEIVEERLQGVLKRTARVLMPQLSREGRTDEAWREALKALTDHQGDYRKAAVPRERVREILEDPAAPPEQRLGAAVALVEAEDKEAHRILVSVSEAIADPELRGPLAKLAKEAEEFVEEEVEVGASAGSA